MDPCVIARRKHILSLLACAALFPALMVYFFPKIQKSSDVVPSVPSIKNRIIAAPFQVEEQAIPAAPVRLKIPKIHIDAFVEQRGVTVLGAMDVPEIPYNVAWFAVGPHPGENGSAVMSGHFGWKNSIPAVFDDLYQLHQGDKLTVEDEKGVITIFVVRELRVYGENENASDVFVSNDGKAHLNLVTCQGVWNKDKKSYSNRLVVFTDKSN